ncbi:MAG: glycosyltransferase family 39 protein [Caldilineaceae bacterium]|nr:glycosyltransferase family 39 protein [Caldilineaceae bacterium]
MASYVEAGFLALLGQSYTVARLPSLIFGLATIVVIWFVGRREWVQPVGWLAALGLALLPEAIIWSGRARFYAQLQFLVLIMVWAAYAAATDSATSTRQVARRQWTFVLFFVLALFFARRDLAALSLHPARLSAVARLALSAAHAGLERADLLPDRHRRPLSCGDLGPARLLRDHPGAAALRGAGVRLVRCVGDLLAAADRTDAAALEPGRDAGHRGCADRAGQGWLAFARSF